MKIHKEGFRTILLCAIVAAVIIVPTLFLIVPEYPVVGWITIAAVVALVLFIISFFRIPKRTHAAGEDLIVAPCDGTVVVIEEV